MKSILDKLEFIFVMIALVLPPIFSQFNTPKTDVIRPIYGFQTFMLALVSLMIYWKNQNVHLIRFQSKWTLFRVLVLSGESFKAFGALCVISVVFEIIGMFFHFEGISKVILPDSVNLWVNFFAGTICAAFYEEVIYRMYLPESMKHFIVGKPKIPYFLPEIIAVLLFALGHLYLGVLGFLNALLCGIVLRICLLKTHSIWFSFIPHTVYNLGVMFVMGIVTFDLK